jgi:predicted dehydrogenase
VSRATRVGIVGDGWRAQFFHRIAAVLPGEFEIVGVVVRSAATAERVSHNWGTGTYGSVAELVTAQHPDFVISSAPRDVNVEVMVACVELSVPVLCETPPAEDADALRALWERVGSSGLVHVAEQYLLMPAHAAKKALVGTGVIGDATSVQISSTHLYHAVSIMRGLLGVGFEPASITSQRFVAPLADPLGQKGWTGDRDPKPTPTTIATIDFGGAMGLYDFTDNQWHNQLRSRRLVVRGSLGEISNDEVVRLAPTDTVLHSSITRRQIGYDLDLDGYDTDHLDFEGSILWQNPFVGSRFSDEEIAIATMMRTTAAWSRGEGDGPYPLADACQDHLIGLAIEAGGTTTTDLEPWAGKTAIRGARTSG